MATDDDRRAAELRAQGKTWAEIATALEGPTDGPTDAELAHASASTAARVGATPVGAEPDAHPLDAAWAAHREVREFGGSTDKASTAFLQSLMDSAVSGDERVANTSGRFEPRRRR